VLTLFLSPGRRVALIQRQVHVSCRVLLTLASPNHAPVAFKLVLFSKRSTDCLLWFKCWYRISNRVPLRFAFFYCWIPGLLWLAGSNCFNSPCASGWRLQIIILLWSWSNNATLGKFPHPVLVLDTSVLRSACGVDINLDETSNGGISHSFQHTNISQKHVVFLFFNWNARNMNKRWGPENAFILSSCPFRTAFLLKFIFFSYRAPCAQVGITRRTEHKIPTALALLYAAIGITQRRCLISTVFLPRRRCSASFLSPAVP